MGPTFEEYLVSKKIDTERFRRGEPELWDSWKREFEQMHPNSFTVQKLNLINPIRRKYLLPPDTAAGNLPDAVPAPNPGNKPGRPIIRPKRD